MTETLAKPNVVPPAEWLDARKALIAEEKELTKHIDRVNAARRRFPMVKIEKSYVFDGSEGKRTLLDLFEGKRQLIVYHFMFDPVWEEGCTGCTGLVNALGDLSMFGDRDTTFALVSRARIEKLEAYRIAHGWDRTWVSSYGSDFNYGFHVTHDENVASIEYNYAHNDRMKGESHGLSVFFRVDEIFHAYSTYARGCESLTDSYRLLDVTPYGRQEDFEDSPEGWPKKPTYG